MERIRAFFNKILILLGLAKPQPKTPESLDAEILSQVFKEAEFLKGTHKVDVQDLAPGEEPGPPRAVGEEPPEMASPKAAE